MKTETRNNINFHLCDCIEFMKSLPNNYFSLSICDPPYGIGADRNQEDLAGKKGFTKNAGTYKKYHKTNWDNEIPTLEYFTELQRISKNQIIWGGNYFHEYRTNGVIIWNKGRSGNFKEGELAKTNFNTFKIFNYSRSDAYINDCDFKIHPTQKPVKLYRWILQNYAETGWKILDTHGGSMSSAIACDMEGFSLDICEIDAEYFDAGLKRFDEYKKQLKLNFDC